LKYACGVICIKPPRHVILRQALVIVVVAEQVPLLVERQAAIVRVPLAITASDLPSGLSRKTPPAPVTAVGVLSGREQGPVPQ